MERAFRCRVFNRYGSSEVSIIAAEDGTGHGLRVAPTVHVETLRADGSACEDGECGEIAVTSLANFVMPLIRFRIGDVGALQRTNGKMYLERVLGRTVELFQTRQGTKIDGQYFIQCMYFRNWVKRFCFRQVEYERVVIDVELAAEPPGEDLRDIEESIKHVMGHDMTVVWNYVSEIKPLPSGKRLYTICEV
jgi:phenylacetate-CoA ligase